MRIYKEFFFEAAHFLPSAPPGHPNARVHGHSFRARITVDGEPDEDTGIIVHFDELEAAVAEARDALDHRMLNEVEGLQYPTLERIAMWLWDRLHNRLPGLVEIVVARDSCHEGCVYQGPPMRLAAGVDHDAEDHRVRQLGHETKVPGAPEEAELERVPNPHAGTVYVARFTAPEFTCLCPVTGQPDFAHFVVDYAPSQWLLESKSFKLFLASFRNASAFHEDATLTIGKRIADLIEPSWLRIGGYWYPRGGIPIDVFWQHGTPPEGVWIPDQGVAPYRGRG